MEMRRPIKFFLVFVSHTSYSFLEQCKDIKECIIALAEEHTKVKEVAEATVWVGILSSFLVLENIISFLVEVEDKGKDI